MQKLTFATSWPAFWLSLAAIMLLTAGILAGFQGNISAAEPGRKNHKARRRKHTPQRKNVTSSRTSRKEKENIPDMGILCLEVASRLEAGSTPENAWKSCLEYLHPGLQLLDLQNPQHLPTRALRKVFRQEAQKRAVRAVMAAIELSTVLGAPLAQILTQCSQGITAATRATMERQSAQSGPKTTARMLGILPLVALIGAGILGVDLPRMLVETGAVRTSFIVGIIAFIAGNLWSYQLIKQATNTQLAQIDSAWGMQLCAAAIQSGASIPRAIDALGQALSDKNLEGCGKLLIMGASWEETWQKAGATWSDLARALRPAWEDGALAVPLLQAGARNQNEQASYKAKIAAEKLGVKLVMPMGICLLPAFLALGLVPIIISTLENIIL